MYCSNCDKENEDSALFCGECGKPLQGNQDTNQNSEDIPVEEISLNKSQKKKWMFYGAIIVVIILFIMTLCWGADDIEYTNNSGDKLPIVVNQISIQENWTGFIDITFEIENLTQTDYRDVRLAVLAWDSEGYPIRLCGMYEIDSTYVNYIDLENMSPEELDKYTYTFEGADIKYMSVFVSYCQDFENEEWENPVIEDIEENQGKKLDETEIYYFTFQ